MIKDILNLQGNDIQLLEEGCVICLETKKKLRLDIKLTEDDD